ncbi:MAG TPA: molybdopterin-binding protein [Nitrososphaerales archaeon]|nr:molybdopterin-binding protein [Nitrososphaerales archaeon]
MPRKRLDMVRVEMLAVGKELLIGRTLNTNAHWLGKRLARMGSMLKLVTTVDDELSEISAALKGALARSPEFLVVVGGLGPTPDDMTLEAIAAGLGVGLRQSGAALTLIKEHYAKRGLGSIELTPARKKMARLPVGAEPLMNTAGTAPGVRLAVGRTAVYCLPGVPVEMREIFRRSVEPEIKKKIGKLHRKYLTLKLEGVFESALAPIIGEELRRHPGSYIKSHPRGIREGVSRIELDIAVVGEDSRRTDRIAWEIAKDMESAVGKIGGTVRRTAGSGE